MRRSSWASITPSSLDIHRKSDNARGRWLISTVVLLIALFSLPARSQGSDPVSTARQLIVEWPNAQAGKSNLQTILRTQQARPGFDKKRIDPAELATVKIPVLLPEQLFDFDSLVVRADRSGHGYFATARRKGLAVLVTGSRIVHAPPEQSPASGRLAAPKTAKYTIRRTEVGINLGLSRYGIPYTITFECEQRTDPRCTREQEISSLADRMVFVGGEP